MYKINSNSNTVVNAELALLRGVNPDLALGLRKVYSHLQCKTFDELPAIGSDLAKVVTNEALLNFALTGKANTLIEWLEFEEVDVVDVPEITVEEDRDRFEFIETTKYSDMTAEQLSLVLFRDLGAEIESATQSMTTGLKLKLDLLDELKDNLRALYPDVRVEVLTEKLTKALAVTKTLKGSSLSLTNGTLAVYDNMGTLENPSDVENFKFLADFEANKTQSLDILILQSAFKAYKLAVASGELQATCQDLNLAIMKMVSGIKTTSEESKNKLQNLF